MSPKHVILGSATKNHEGVPLLGGDLFDRDLSSAVRYLRPADGTPIFD
jgi:hypothetical protein